MSDETGLNNSKYSHRGLGNSAVESTLADQGLVRSRLTRMLVDTGSAATILHEEFGREQEALQ